MGTISWNWGACCEIKSPNCPEFINKACSGSAQLALWPQKGDWHLTSPYSFTPDSNIKIKRIEEMVSNWKNLVFVYKKSSLSAVPQLRTVWGMYSYWSWGVKVKTKKEQIFNRNFKMLVKGVSWKILRPYRQIFLKLITVKSAVNAKKSNITNR